MKTNTCKFFGTRDLARAAAKELNGKFIDNGSSAPKGERWAVELPVEVESHDLNKEIALLQESLKASTPEYQLLVVKKPSCTATNLKGKTIPVHYKKSVQVLAA